MSDSAFPLLAVYSLVLAPAVGLGQTRFRLGVALCIVLSALMMVPVDGMAILFYIRSLTADISVLHVAYIWSGIIAMFMHRTVVRVPPRWAALLVVSGLAFYLSSLGAVPFDLYALGYGSPVALACVLAIFVMLLLYGHAWAALLLALACLGWQYRLLESDNLFDYLFDIWFWFYCWGVMLSATLRKVWERRRAQRSSTANGKRSRAQRT